MSKRELIREVIKNLDSPPVSFDYGDTWESIKFYGDCEKPPKEEFEAKLKELVDAQPLKELRQERDRRLQAADWVAVKAFTTSTPVPQEWLDYMQALRDLPATTEDPKNPVWPTAPTS